MKITYVNCGLINACKSDLGSDEHYLSSSGNKAREKFRAKQEFNQRFKVRPCSVSQTCLRVVMFPLGSQYFSKFVSSLIFHAVSVL